MNRHQQIIIFLTLLLQFLAPSVSELYRVDDERMLSSTYNQSVLVFFTKSTECQECEYFKEVITADSDLFQDLRINILMVYDSNLTHLYSPHGAPAVVFFRSGIPMLLAMDTTWENGDPFIRCYYNRNVRPIVELTDDSFDRHMQTTLAGTIDTTDDWFIYFHNQSCAECKALDAMWEGLAGEQNADMGYGNITKVGKINIASDGKMTARRFGIEKVPQFIFLIQNMVYFVYNRPEGEHYRIKSFLEFAKIGYVYSDHYIVPPPAIPSYYEKFLGECRYMVSKIKRKYQEHSKTVWLCFIICFGLMHDVYFVFNEWIKERGIGKGHL